MPSEYSIQVAPTCFQALRAVKDKKLKRQLVNAIEGLAQEPDAQGKALTKPFEGLRSLRAVRNRYRVLYRIDASERRISVLLVGERKAGYETDIYAVAQKLLKTLLKIED